MKLTAHSPLTHSDTDDVLRSAKDTDKERDNGKGRGKQAEVKQRQREKEKNKEEEEEKCDKLRITDGLGHEDNSKRRREHGGGNSRGKMLQYVTDMKRAARGRKHQG